jgi:AraC family transcriptional regulator
MREYDADLVSKVATRWGGVGVEMIERRLGPMPSSLHVSSTDHAVYVEMSEGIVCEREVLGSDRTRFVTEPQLISFRPAGSEVRGTTTGEGTFRYGVVFIDPGNEDLRHCLGDPPPKLKPLTGMRSDRVWHEMAPLLSECTAEAPVERPFATLYALGHALALLALLANETVTLQRGDDRHRDTRITHALGWINDNLTREFTLGELAAVVNVSASQLVRMFRSSLGLTPMAYVSNQRVREAQRLLASSDMPIAHVALHLGYSDQSHFTHRFKSNTGVTPASYRRGRRAS